MKYCRFYDSNVMEATDGAKEGCHVTITKPKTVARSSVQRSVTIFLGQK